MQVSHGVVPRVSVCERPLGPVSSELDHLYKIVYTSGLEVSFAAVENWLAARSCSSLAAMAVAAFKALRAWDCA